MKKIVIGVDEAGRGCLAGSVFAAALCFDNDSLCTEIQNNFKDSKTISEKRRFELYDLIKSNNIPYCVSSKSASEIDRTDILKSTMAAMTDSISDLMTKLSNVYKDFLVEVIVDGNKTPFINGVDIKAVVKADKIFPVVSAASIVAKCEKDIEAYKIHEEFPQYGFNCHKSYGTSTHIDAINRFGPCKYHRASYAPVKQQGYSNSFHRLKDKILSTPSEYSEAVFFEIATCYQHELTENEKQCLKKIHSKKMKKIF